MRNANHTQIELTLRPSEDVPFFHNHRHYPRPQRPCRRARARWWFRQMHAIIDAIPDAEQT